MRFVFRSIVAFAAILASALMTGGSSAAAAESSTPVSASSSVATLGLLGGEVDLTSAKSAAAVPTTCSWTGASVTGSPSYSTEAPRPLTAVAWTGTVNSSCTGSNPVTISTSIQVTDPQGASHLVASGSGSPVSVGYICSQAVTNCAGAWSAQFTITFSAQAGSTWPGSSTCIPSGAVLTCTFGGSSGYFPPVQVPEHTTCSESTSTVLLAAASCYNLPPTGDIPLLSLRAINNIRDYHFEGGSNADDTKGLFYSTLTNSDLTKIWEAGMTDTGDWQLNSSNYYEKTFAYSGAGIQSPLYGAGSPATKVTLVVEQYGAGGYSEVVTMYPATG